MSSITTHAPACTATQDIIVPEPADLGNGKDQHRARHTAERSSSGSLLDGEDYVMDSSDDFIEDDLADIHEDGQAFEALLAARMPKSSYVLLNDSQHFLRLPTCGSCARPAPFQLTFPLCTACRCAYSSLGLRRTT